MSAHVLYSLKFSHNLPFFWNACTSGHVAGHHRATTNLSAWWWYLLVKLSVDQSAKQTTLYLVLIDQPASCSIPYSGKLSREKTFANWWKYNFRRENFRGLHAFAMPKDATPQISQRKLSRIATKPQNSRKFSPSKVFRYTVSDW